MWIRLLGVPWWQRWLVQFCIVAVCFAVITPFAAPHLLSGLSWPWRVALLGGFSALFAGLLVVSTLRASREYLAVTRGLDREERSRAIRASMRGEVPTSAAAVGAALRIGAIRLGHGRSTPNRIAVIYGVLFASWLLLTVGGAATNDTRQTVPQGAFTALIGIVGIRGWFVARRVENRVTLLQNVLENIPGGADALAAVPYELPAGQRWRPIAASVTGVVLLATGALAAVYLAHRPSPDCRTAADVERLVVAQRDMLDPAFITADSGGPALADYQGWSQRLRSYKASVSAPDVAAHVRSIGDLSDQAVAVVSAARADPAGSQAPPQEQRRSTYAGIVSKIVTELKALDASCPTRG